MGSGSIAAASIRAYEHGGAIRRRVAVLRHRFWSVVTGAEIPLGSRIAGGLLIPHPNGIVIHPDAVIGPNCLLFQQVTLGTMRKTGGAPVLGGHVDVGAGAKVLGDITVGANARIGANAVVVSDVADGSTVVGIPARPIEESIERLRQLVHALRNAVGEDSGPGRSSEAHTIARQAERELLDAIEMTCRSSLTAAEIEHVIVETRAWVVEEAATLCEQHDGCDDCVAAMRARIHRRGA